MKNLVLFLFAIFSGLSAFAQMPIIRHTIDSKILDQQRPINVIVPDSTYGYQWGDKVNVVYVLDGSEQFLNLVAAHFAMFEPAFMVVGIPSLETRRDDFFVKSDYYKKGRADKFISFLSDELFPMIESRYKVTQHRVGVGHSLGGSLLLRILSERDSLMNAYMMFSPNLMEGPLFNDFARKYKQCERLDKFIVMTVGDTEKMDIRFRKGVQTFDSLVVNTPAKAGFQYHFDYLTKVAHHESMQFSLPGAVRSYFKDTYSLPSDSLRTICLAEADYPSAIKRYYEGRKAAMGYLYYPDPYGFYNAWVDFANENEQPEKALQAVDMAIEIHTGNMYQYFLYLAKADIYMTLGKKSAALKACDESLKSLQSVRDKYAGDAEEDYQWCEEEILEKIAEIKAPKNK